MATTRRRFAPRGGPWSLARRLGISVFALAVMSPFVFSGTAGAVGPPTAPGSPIGVAIHAAVAGGTVSWSAPLSDGGSQLTGYVVTPSVGDPVTVAATETETIVNADPGVAVSVTVVAVNAVGSSVAVAAGPVTASAPGGLVRAQMPRRLVDSRSGVGVAAGKLAANTERLVQVTGKAGVPASGVASVFVDVTAIDVAANTSLRVFPDGAPLPAISSLDALKGERIIQMVEVKVGTAGRIRVHNGAGATNLILDVSGYSLTPTASGASTNGVVTTTAPFELLNTRTGVGAPKAKVGAAKFVDATVLGKDGVPATGVAAVFVNVTAYGPSAVTTVAVYPNGSAPSTPSLAVLPGAGRTNRVLVPVAPGGKVRIKNEIGTVDLKLDLSGWVANGSDSALGADSFNPQPHARLADSRNGTGTPNGPLAKGAERIIVVAGAAGVPKTTSATPATAVLAFVRVYTATTASSVALRAAGTPSAPVVDVTGRSGQTMGNLVLVALSVDGKIAIRSGSASTGGIDFVVDIVGWVGGSVLVDSDTHILDTATKAAITTVTPTAVTMSTSTGSAATLHVGDIIAVGVTTKTPAGLLRRITALSSGTGTRTFTTIDVGVADAIRRGHVTSGAAPGAPAPPTAPGVSAPHISKPHISKPHISGSVGISVSYDVPFNETLAESGGAAVTLTGGFHVGANASLALDVGFFHSQAAFDAGVSESFDAELTASYQADWSMSKDLGTKSFGTYEFQVGPVPVIVQPELRLSIETTGHVEGTASAGVHQRLGASAGVTVGSGGTTTRSDVDAPPPTFDGPTATAKVTARVTAVPAVVLKFYGAAEAGLQLRPYLELDGNVCKVDLNAGVDLGFIVDINILGHNLGEYTPDPVNLAKTTLATLTLRDCAVWSGTLSFHINTHAKDDQGRSVGDLNASESVSLTAPADGLPPPSTYYDSTGSGSGAEIATTYACEPGAISFTTNWGGPMLLTPRFAITPSVYSGYLVINALIATRFDSTSSASGCGTSDGPSSGLKDGYFRMLPVQNAGAPLGEGGSDTIFFAAPAGQTSFAGSRDWDVPQPNGGTLHETFTYALHKTCVEGGTDC